MLSQQTRELRDERGLSSLAVVSDWREWWQAWGPKIAAAHGRAGWILFLLDANEKLQEGSVLISRIMRNKPEWDTAGWTPAEWLNVEDQTAAALSWFERNAEAPLKDCPDWAVFIFKAMHGNFAVLKRLGRELRALQEQGYLVATLERDASRVGGLRFGGDAAEVVTREAD